MDYWHKQDANKTLFPDLLWSRPENKRQAGKLLVIGGNAFGFSAVGQAYSSAVSAGAGTVRVLLPDAIRKVVQGVIEHAEFATSNPSGSFGKEALAELLMQADWADGVLIAGDVGHNSETSIVLEQFLSKHSGPTILTQDTLDIALATPDMVCRRKNTLAVASMAQLQKLAISARFDKPFRLGMDLMQLVNNLRDFTLKFPVYVMVKHLDQIAVAVQGQVSTTKLNEEEEVWRVKFAARASVWWLQNSDKPFEAFTTSLCQN